ncbi:B12-binding domain-containing radical SAM protein [Carboxylicivirga marina]|uniref:B12-binding domain-containing radical SAM protein n=1 Tax=Carboxylicivirga marina TaxID=2800988 RepID=UPI002592772E|nr:cobalamin-dependent protein [uncultured Carboxylicivirga sp.]
MKVLFVRPKPSTETIGLQHIMIVEPLELEILATLIQKDSDVKIIDMILEKRDLHDFLKEYQPDIFCVTGYITHIGIMRDYCHEAKLFNSTIKTIVGGIHVEKFPEDLDTDFIDFRVIRNATSVFPDLIEHIKGSAELPPGILKKRETYTESSLPDYIFKAVIPDRKLTQRYRKKYFYIFHKKIALLKTSYGCPYMCKFCYCRKITGDQYKELPLQHVFKELKTITEKEIYIIDDNFLCSRERVQNFISLIKKHKIKKKYLVFGRADFIADNADVISSFKKVGLKSILVGLESFNNNELTNYFKNSNSLTNQRAVEVLNKNKIDCYAAIITSPAWTKNDFKQAYSIMNRIGLKFINLQPLTPLKGTDLPTEDSSLLIPRENFASWDLAHVMLQPENMTVDEYYKNLLKLYNKVIFKPKHLIGYIKYSPVMQFRILAGLYKIHKQYKTIIIKNNNYAQDIIYSTKPV